MIRSHSTSLFSYSDKTLTTEISNLGPNPWCQAYEDACDLGIRVVSHKTNREVTFVVMREDKILGDIVSWHLEPVRGSVPETQGLHMVLFND